MNITVKHIRVFRRLFLYFSAAIILPLSLLGFSTVNNAYSTFLKTRKTEMETCSDTVFALMQRVQNFAFSLTIQPLTYDFLANGFNQSVYDQFLVGSYLNKIAETEKLIESVYLISDTTGKTAGTGLGIIKGTLLKDAFLDSIDLGPAIQKWYPLRPDENAYTAETDPPVVSFVTRAPLDDFSNPGYVVINMNTDLFRNALEPPAGTIYWSLASGEGETLLTWKTPGESIPSALPQSYFTFLMSRESLFSLEDKIERGRWNIRFVLPRKVIDSALRSTVFSFSLALFISLLLGVLFSSVMAVRSVRQADRIDLLLDENSHIQEEIMRNRPVMEEQLLSRILYNTFSDWKELIPELDYLNISFENGLFVPLIIRIIPSEKDQDDITRANAINHLARTAARNELSRFFPVSSAVTVGKNRFALILNPEEINFASPLREELIRACDKIGKGINEQADGIVLFSFGASVKKWHDLYESFLQARDKIQYNLNVGNNIYFPGRDDRETSYPIVSAKQIIASLEKRDAPMTDRYTNRFFKETREGDDSLILHDRVVYLLYTVAAHFIEEGLKIPPELMRWESWFREKRTSDELEESVKGFFHAILKELNQFPGINANDYAHKAMEFMEENYHDDISLDQIASHVSLHPNYLSRIFKEYKGLTVLEYMTNLRMKKARKLLMETTDSVNAISAGLGYNDARSFIRYFKKYEGVTPGKFRERTRI